MVKRVTRGRGDADSALDVRVETAKRGDSVCDDRELPDDDGLFAVE